MKCADMFNESFSRNFKKCNKIQCNQLKGKLFYGLRSEKDFEPPCTHFIQDGHNDFRSWFLKLCLEALIFTFWWLHS